MDEEIDYLVCKNCDTPCYVFDLDRKRKIASAFCAACGNENPEHFRIPDVDDDDVDVDEVKPR